LDGYNGYVKILDVKCAFSRAQLFGGKNNFLLQLLAVIKPTTTSQTTMFRTSAMTPALHTHRGGATQAPHRMCFVMSPDAAAANGFSIGFPPAFLPHHMTPITYPGMHSSVHLSNLFPDGVGAVQYNPRIVAMVTDSDAGSVSTPTPPSTPTLPSTPTPPSTPVAIMPQSPVLDCLDEEPLDLGVFDNDFDPLLNIMGDDDDSWEDLFDRHMFCAATSDVIQEYDAAVPNFDWKTSTDSTNFHWTLTESTENGKSDRNQACVWTCQKRTTNLMFHCVSSAGEQQVGKRDRLDDNTASPTKKPRLDMPSVPFPDGRMPSRAFVEQLAAYHGIKDATCDVVDLQRTVNPYDGELTFPSFITVKGQDKREYHLFLLRKRASSHCSLRDTLLKTGTNPVAMKTPSNDTVAYCTEANNNKKKVYHSRLWVCLPASEQINWLQPTD
jgi:hypothetical protein